MTYQTLYRKYRSTNFNELVGQDHIIKTLSNAIEYERLSHAYIFSGPRGTGKTSTARILAKMVNKTTDNMADCELCKKITNGVCVDVIEIDAASHTGVDHMRQLTEQVQFLPIESKYKVFIIDEVHMLSTGAFNALLKTLEEPPSNILFILATTELHKIPATIQSRAQTLHFRLLDNDLITNHIQHVCNEENITISNPVLIKLVNSSNGGMRDALSLLDQLISVSTNSEITLEDISLVLGTVNETAIIDFLNDCFSNSATAVQKLADFINQGVNVFQLYDDVLGYLNQTFLIAKSHSFNASEQQISDWMLWFCNQLAFLKSVPFIDVAAQVSLNSRLLSYSSEQIVVSSPNVKSTPSPNIQTPPPPKINSQPVVKSAPPISTPAQSTPVASAPEKVSVAKSSSSADVDKKDFMPLIMSKVNDEFKVLAPVLTGAAFVEHGEYLCLILEESYQFFQKKLAEIKFQNWFLDQYNQIAKTNFVKWFVTSDVNEIYNLTIEKSAESPQDNKGDDTVKSNTVNQIVEMFDAHVIH